MRAAVMTSARPNWEPNKDLPVGKGATFQQYVATVGDEKLEIDVAPWGRGPFEGQRTENRTGQGCQDSNRPFAISNRLPSATCKGRQSNPRERGAPPCFQSSRPSCSRARKASFSA